MARMVLLGVGTAVPDADRECTHMVWDDPGAPLLIDAAGNTYGRLLKAGIDPQELRGVVLTHSHSDHVYGFPILLTQLFLAGRRTPLPVYGLQQTLDLVAALIEASQVADYMVPVEWLPITAGDPIPLQAAYSLRTALTQHSRPCIALRFEDRQAGWALTYSADTSPRQSVIDLAQGSNVLIHEATVSEPFEGHSTPRQAGEVALAAGVARLVMVHFSPRWTMPEEQAVAEAHAAGFAGQVEVGHEGQPVEPLSIK